MKKNASLAILGLAVLLSAALSAASVSDKGDHFTDEEPLVLDLGGQPLAVTDGLGGGGGGGGGNTNNPRNGGRGGNGTVILVFTPKQGLTIYVR